MMRRLWRAIALVLLGGVVGTGFGVALGFFLFPFAFPPPPASERLSDLERSQIVATGSFIHAHPADPIHWGRGKVSVSQQAVFLEEDCGPSREASATPYPRV